MSKEKALVKNTLIVTIGKICTQFISFILLPLYTALLTTEQYGVVDLLNTLINLITPILLFKIEDGIFRFLIDKREDNKGKKQIITTTIYFTIIQLVSILNRG